MKPTTLATALLCLTQVPLSAQNAPAAGSLSGRILDGASGRPVAGALVRLDPAVAALVTDPGHSAELVNARLLITGEAGAYRFSDVAPGSYLLRVERIGYRSATIHIEVRRASAAGISVGLELSPVALEPMRIEQQAAALFQRATGSATDLDEARITAERSRQALFLAPDARMLTYADVMDGVTLGEGDVFRALQRFPGVGTRDDYTAELWTRGAPWTHTRVTFDGVPLFNPVHAVGVLSAITPEILGAVFFHPGMRPAGVAGGAAGAVDMRSRAGSGAGAVRAVADVSVASAKLALEQRVEGRGAWIVAARRSHLDVLTGSIDLLGLDTLDLPYVFHDVAARADLRLGQHAHLEASGLHEQDRLHGDLSGVLERTEARWGNNAGRVTLRARLRGMELSHTLGASRFVTRADERLVRSRDVPEWTEPASRNRVDHTQLGGELQPAGSGSARWTLGYDVAWQDVSYHGPLPRYHAVKPDTTLTIVYERALRTTGAWGELKLPLSDRITMNPGVRIESGGAHEADPAVHVAPRLAVRYALSADHSIAVAAGRSWQFVQALALAGPSFHPAFHASHFWMFADESMPAMRADVISVGSEHWLRGGWLASITGYQRRITHMTLPDPAPGRLTLARRPVHDGVNSARGIDAGLRRIGARWSAALGYSYGRSDVDAAGLRFPSAADRRHVADAMVALRVTNALRVAAAYTSMSGAPYTRAYATTSNDCTSFGFGCEYPPGSIIEAPNAERTPSYGSLDASLQLSHRFRGVDMSAYVQVRNVLGRDNASTYAGTRRLDTPVSAPRETSQRTAPTRVERQTTSRGTIVLLEDQFERGLPRMPLFGLRLTF